MIRKNFLNRAAHPTGVSVGALARMLTLAVALATSPALRAGAYIFAGETNGIDVITHPAGYMGDGGTLRLGVCIDPASQKRDELVVPVRNNITVWNALQPVLSNVELNAVSGFDAESILLHELGHCIGLAHVNAASESGLSSSNQNYTKATDGDNNRFDVDPGPDGVIGSWDDVRGDDVNLHWFNPANDPFLLPLPQPVDTTRYRRDLADLPPGDSFAQNASRDVATALGYPGAEAVMQQGTYYGETQRDLVSDDASTILLAASGLDERTGTADDYRIELGFLGISDGPGCDISVILEDMTGLAYCSVGGYFVGNGHVRISTASIHLGSGYTYHFNSELRDGGGTGNQQPVAASDNATVDEDDVVDVAVLANDSDPDGGSLVVTAVGNPPHGSATLNLDDSIRYTPEANYHGADSFAYTIADGQGGSDSATVSVTVASVNDLPVAADDSGVTTAYETPVDIDVLANDSDVDGDALNVATVGSAAGGVTANRGAYVTYQPDPGFSGQDSFQYTVTDGEPGSSDTATVTLTVGEPDQPPPATPDYAVADWGTVEGSVDGTYTATLAGDGVYQAIGETHTGGKPSLRADSLEHVWQFDLAGSNHVFNVDAQAEFPTADADSSFRFEWSESPSGPWQTMLWLTAGSSGLQAYDVGFGVGGTVYVRVVDGDGTAGNTVYSTVRVDHMYFDASSAPPPEPPPPPEAASELRVASIVPGTVNASKGSKQAQAVVAVVDDLGNPVANALVSGRFSGSYNEISAATTDATGTATLTTQGTTKGGVSFSFCVDSIDGALPYSPVTPDCASY